MEYTLSHHGIKGMRWGIRRYQRRDGSLTRAGKKRAEQIKRENLEKARQAKAEKKQHEADKKAALKSGSASDVLKFKGELTKQEMDSAWARIQWEQNMSGVAAKDVSAGKSRADKFFASVGDATDKANTAAKAWNTIANVYNAFNQKGIVLPKIDTNISSGNKQEVSAAKKLKQKAEEAVNKRKEQEAQRESKQKERAEKRAAAEEANKTERTVHEGEVIGGSSKKQSSNTTNKRSNDTIIDADWSEVSISNVPAATVNRGQNFVAGLLEAPKDDD